MTTSADPRASLQTCIGTFAGSVCGFPADHLLHQPSTPNGHAFRPAPVPVQETWHCGWCLGDHPVALAQCPSFTPRRAREEAGHGR